MSSKLAIPLFDYVEQYRQIEAEVLAAVSHVFESGSLILGPSVRAFEEHFVQFLQVDGQAVGVGNGTDAIAIALRALDVGPGDEVITVSNTAIPTVSAIRMSGARPVFCEIDPDTLLMDLADAERHITSRTRAIIPVHLFGNAVEMPRLMQLARRNGLAVVEDCAQSCGSTWRGQMTGTFGDIGCFSFYPTKNLGAYGDGGLCFTRDQELADAMRQIRSYGCGKSYDCQREGVNSRLDEVQAAILDVKLRHLARFVTQRRAVAAVYDEHLPSNLTRLTRPRIAPEVDHSRHLYTIIVADRDALTARLGQEGIGFGVHYPVPIHRMRGYDFLGQPKGSLPLTERLADEVLSLPCSPELQHGDVRRVCHIVKDVIQSNT